MKHFKFRFPTYDNNSHASSATTKWLLNADPLTFQNMVKRPSTATQMTKKLFFFQDDDTVVIGNNFEKFVSQVMSSEFAGRSPGPEIPGLMVESIVSPFCMETWPITKAAVIRPDNQKFTASEVERWSVSREIFPNDFYPAVYIVNMISRLFVNYRCKLYKL